MKQYKLFQLTLSLILTTLALDACTFSVQTLSTPSPEPPTIPAAISPAAAATQTAIPATALPASATPTVIPTKAGTIPSLEASGSFEVPDDARSLAFTPDSTVLAIGVGNSEAFTVQLWDIVNGKSLGTLDGHTNIVWNVAFSPDGEMLASVSNDKTAKIWDWRNKTLLKSLDFPGETVSVGFSPDGQTLAVGGVDTKENQVQNAAIWTYAVGSWQPLLKFPEYMDIGTLAYSPKGGILIGGGTSRNVQVWNANDGARLYTLNHAHQVSKVAISPDGSTVAAATCENVVYPECADGGIWLWDLPSGKLLRKLAGFPDFVENVAFTPDGSALIAASRDGTLRFYNTSNYQPVYEYVQPTGITTLAVSPDGRLLGTGNYKGEVFLWKIVYHS